MKNTNHHGMRLCCVFLCFALIIIGLVWRLYELIILQRPFLQGQGNARSLRVVEIPAHRGMILDRMGAPLAVSSPVMAVWINPKNFEPNKKQIRSIAKLLNLPTKAIIKSMQYKKEFVYLKRQVLPSVAKKLEDLKIKGLGFLQEFKRFYPEGETVSQLIGFTNIDDYGIEGIELEYQYWLKGVSGKKKVIKDRDGRIIDALEVITEPKPGNNIKLTIDKRIQFFAYNELKNTIEKYAAKAGSVVVLDSQTGDVLAVANYPSFNPNIRGNYTKDAYRNIAVTDLFEPGSVIKPFSIASALESGLFTPETIIDTTKSLVVHGKPIRDVHNYGLLDVIGVLQKSSNIGVTKMVLASPPEQLIGLLQASGFGQRTESGAPGESEGFIVDLKGINPFVLATVGFGYGISVTALQLAKAYLIFANDGKLIPVKFIHNNNDTAEIRQVIKPKTAEQLLAMMEAVVAGGTGIQAGVPGYRVAGKTGTARIAGKHGYEAHKHIASFVGIAPVTNPRLVVAVIIYEPSKGGYYANIVAAPLFAKIMAASLRTLDVLPDNLKEETNVT